MLNLSKQKITGIKIWFALLYYKYFIWLSIAWYTLTMKLTKTNASRVSLYADNTAIADSLDWGRLYKKDAFKDHLTHPSRLAKNIEEDKLFGDCDDHAIYWCTALLKSGMAEKAWFCFYTMIKKNSSELSSHALCVFQKEDDWYYWTDYHLPSCIMEGRHKWARRSAEVYDATPIAAVMVEVKEIKEDDTPIFGKIEVIDIL